MNNELVFVAIWTYLIAGNEVEVLTANATKSVNVVMVIVAPERAMTSLIVSTTVRLVFCLSSSSTKINMSSIPIPRIKNGRTPTRLTKGTRHHIAKPNPANIPRATANTPAFASNECPVSGFRNFPSMTHAKVIMRVNVIDTRRTSEPLLSEMASSRLRSLE